MLRNLDLSGNDFAHLPQSIRLLNNLRSLKLSNCKKVQEIPELPMNIKRVEARDCGSVERFSQQDEVVHDPSSSSSASYFSGYSSWETDSISFDLKEGCADFLELDYDLKLNKRTTEESPMADNFTEWLPEPPMPFDTDDHYEEGSVAFINSSTTQESDWDQMGLRKGGPRKPRLYTRKGFKRPKSHFAAEVSGKG
ncbi:hypothetical protein GH714_021031 [Hevea brasiliensis]|uniref:Uncharacterized protein n=1 Tax=Hevea brasiliensis TaxID=3981 RepID=A0A6A6K6M4_HEVBR|nr:hypothetical protein GH714_021031 [Hevea brasiliensis]